MQPENQTFLDFSERTNRLALELSVSLEQLPAKMGISRATFFANRAGKSPISSKTWLKLEALEEQVFPQPPVQKGESDLQYPPGNPRILAVGLRQEAQEHKKQYFRLMQIADLIDPPPPEKYSDHNEQT